MIGMQQQPARPIPAGQRFVDVSRQTMRVIDIIASWVVNTFYNYLHQEAVGLHTNGRVGSITDGYRYIVKQYLDSFNSAEGYKRLIISLHKYYVDNSHCAAIAFDEWTKEVLEQFVPLDYKAIMSNEQQDILLRNILLNAIEQFSSDVLCTKLLDLLISNHDEPSIVSQMKGSMKSTLLAERQKIFNNIHRASTGSDSTPQMSIKREICTLLEENVILKSKNGKLTESVKKSLEGMKMRDKAISVLKTQVVDLQRQLQQLQISAVPLVVQPVSQAEEFKSSLATIGGASYHGASSAVRALPPMTARYDPQMDMKHAAAPLRPILKQRDASPAALPSYMTSHVQPAETKMHASLAQQVAQTQQVAQPVAAPLSHLEKTPEPFEQADPEPEPEMAAADTSNVVPTGNDTLALNMDDFMNG